MSERDPIMRRNRKVKSGIIIKKSGIKTVAVKVEQLKRHPVYHKVIKTSSTFLTHSEMTDISVGDQVEIMEIRPVSKHKTWRVSKVIKKAVQISADEIVMGQS